MSFNHSFGDQDLIFVDQLEHIPGLEATPFDQASFLQPVPDDVGLSGTSMTSTPGVDFTDGPVGNVDVSMVDVASSEQGKQVCYGMLVHEKVKLVGKGQELETKILALKDNSQHIHTLSIQPSGDGSLFLRFPDGTDLGYLSRKMEQALEALICLPLFEIDALTNLNSLVESLRRAGKPADAATRVSINVYGREYDRDETLREARQWVEETKALPGASLAKTPSQATLVIVPSRVLINTWEREIDDHLNGGMKMMRYHGRSRKELVSNIDRYDIVITTYNTLAKEHDAKILGKGQSPLHDFAWYRVVLDEVRATKRKAIERLTYLLEAVCLRRTIEHVKLPGQRSELRRVQFTPEERAKYELTRKDMKRFIHQQAGEYNQQAETFGMFQVFLQLRSFCNHGTYQPRFSWAKRNLLEDELDPVCSMTRDSLNRCSGCRQPLPVMPHGRRPKLNLKSVNRVFIVEPQWNPSVESQAVARAIRLGQEQQVLVTRYLVEKSIEEAMCSQQTQKLKISQMDFRKDLEASAAGDEGTSDYPPAMQ
ncbi:hypothetical protein APSETT444_003421 [Aspergillus pseudonomiae]